MLIQVDDWQSRCTWDMLIQGDDWQSRYKYNNIMLDKNI